MPTETKTCSICHREEGHKATDRFGEPDQNPDTPLGSMGSCVDCGSLSVCPDCLHERDCCRDRDNRIEELEWQSRKREKKNA